MGSDGQFDGVQVTGCQISPKATANDIRAALMLINEQCRPCGPDFAMEQLAFLRARTKARADMDGKLTSVAYTDWLAEYPTDAARAACEEWARGMVFWPAWADLQRICDRLVSKRLVLRKALQKALEPAPAALYLGKPLPETREERLRSSIDSFLRHNMPARAARVERELAAEERRDPEEWARLIMDPQQEKPSRPSFQPSSSPTALRCAELAAQRRAGDEAERIQAFDTRSKGT